MEVLWVANGYRCTVPMVLHCSIVCSSAKVNERRWRACVIEIHLAGYGKEKKDIKPINFLVDDVTAISFPIIVEWLEGTA